ncbi:signal-regulatory protein beta-2-like [Xyrauchen texanus]|uniref:signal-regulatory protein beta-2-like n=1 Tax=Xyrauchen texanus TaxID=154827 RepID=UPI00224214B2|nr:signal-regulatory protein beta-2-like [Xyrauchen texanus]
MFVFLRGFKSLLIMRYYLILLISSTIVCSYDMNVVQEDRLKIVRPGDDVNLTCTFSSSLQTTTAWIKQDAGGKSQHIVTFYLTQQSSSNEDLKTNRFIVAKGDDSFNLTILKTKTSDSATYFCVVSSHYNIGMGAGTSLLVKDAAIGTHTILQQSLIDTDPSGDSVTLQCSILTESCAGGYSVFWFKQSLGDSHRGVLYTNGERNGQCKNNEIQSKAQSCVYNLLKRNLSHSDAGIYYCAVATCGEILFGNGTELNFGKSGEMIPTILALGTSNVLFLILAVFLGVKLFRCSNKDPKTREIETEDTVNYAGLSFTQKPLNSQRARANITQEQSLYTQVRSYQ